MTSWPSKLVKLSTADGVWEFIEKAYPIGTVLEVDLDSIRPNPTHKDPQMRLPKEFQDERGTKWIGETITVLTGNMGDFPTEMLSWD